MSPTGGNWKTQYAADNIDSDPSALIGVILDHWQPVFRDELKSTGRNLVGEVRDWRNKWAHHEAFSHDDAYRALDSIERLLALVDAGQAAEVGASKTAVMRARFEAEARSVTPSSASLFRSRPPALSRGGTWLSRTTTWPGASTTWPSSPPTWPKWRLEAGWLSTPTPSSSSGAPTSPSDCEGCLPRPPSASTARGAPVVDLQTNFGGGKTHSMIALYHLFSGLQPSGFPQEVQELLGAAAVKELPAVRRAVVVGTRLSPGQPEVKPDGTEIRTIWGEIAWQLGGLDVFELIAEADRTATNPGAAMEDVLRLCSPCLVLIDEWVAYARQLFETHELLPGGLFETQFSFAQTLAESAMAVPGVLVVVSLPVSDDPARPGVTPIGSEAEVGGVAGQEAARRLGNVIGRTETSWRPASAEESFEIVRRRLFQPIPADQVKHRDGTARAFGEFYRTQAAEFPSEAREPAYLDRLKGAYPIHPELFARLYEDWSTLEGFQRTRGVLRLMAAVISALWAAGDQSPLILPANVPLDDPAVQSELTRNLDHAWQPILDTDVDGPASVPRKLDTEFPNLGRYGAARRAARAVFLATAPRSSSPNLGVELPRVKLACTLPGESVATYGDALNRLTDRSSYLYVEGARYWYGTQASVARRARDLVEQLLSSRLDDVHIHIVARLKDASHDRGEFTAVHTSPGSPAEVPDDAECRLVIIPPSAPHLNRDDSSQAMLAARSILEQRGSAARQYRNMLVFLAPDQRRLPELEHAAAEYLAWSEIHARWEELGLDAFGRNQARSKQGEADQAVELRVGETYHWALVPHRARPDRTHRMGDHENGRPGRSRFADQSQASQLGCARYRLRRRAPPRAARRHRATGAAVG